ncbi:hypothetical protein WOLCODRAFT_155006 [Wolfiporia cocos MD-104 SS10]|uniref:Uncharacterized protein n=1 Tax=Wolfiporia cocos (strain MD-104) TaxID=742152 RepID=A0A2H3K7D8_WOLCO|nr:hypothetical protein WOLCODRAFT_155006 [Wolfiporia cocos MD-104 SS10]
MGQQMLRRFLVAARGGSRSSATRKLPLRYKWRCRLLVPVIGRAPQIARSLSSNTLPSTTLPALSALPACPAPPPRLLPRCPAPPSPRRLQPPRSSRPRDR